ncbi:hypothetical protein SBV1_730062 [Verrucomicrobia bacterium]|nr:hypothetical protein SBV1_730062 [Verrucomicrobiota bacterium]
MFRSEPDHSGTVQSIGAQKASLGQHFVKGKRNYETCILQGTCERHSCRDPRDRGTTAFIGAEDSAPDAAIPSG